MHRGYVKLYRKSIENPLFKKPLIWHYFEYCLLKANHKDKKMIWNKKEITIERGSFLTGRIEAAKETGLSEQNVRTAQKTLINVGALLKINEKSTSKNTYLTVCNYNDYQEDKKSSNQQPTSNQPATNQQVTTNNNEQELINTNKNTYSEEIKEIISFLNLTCKTKYRAETEKTKTLLKTRLSEKYTVEDFKAVILKKFNQWVNTKDEMYLRPETLFGNKFEGYLNQKIIKQDSNNQGNFNKPEVKSLAQIVEEKRNGGKPIFNTGVQQERLE